jgi:hypothetical protein
MDENPSFFNESKQLLVDYVEARIELFKISVYEKIATVSAVLFSSLVIALAGFFVLLFLSISGGLYLGSLLDSNALGFLIVAGIYILLLLFVIIFRKKLLEKHITDKVIEQLFKNEDNDE